VTVTPTILRRKS